MAVVSRPAYAAGSRVRQSPTTVKRSKGSLRRRTSDANYRQDSPPLATMTTVLASAALMSGWLSVAMAGGGKWAG